MRPSSASCVEAEGGQYFGLTACQNGCESKFVCDYTYDSASGNTTWSCNYSPSAQNGLTLTECEAEIAKAQAGQPTYCSQPKFECTYKNGQFVCEDSLNGTYGTKAECELRLNDNCLYRYDCPPGGVGDCVPNSRNSGDFADKTTCEDNKASSCAKYMCSFTGGCYPDASGIYTSELDCKQHCCSGGYPESLGSCYVGLFTGCVEGKTQQWCDQNNGNFYCQRIGCN